MELASSAQIETAEFDPETQERALQFLSFCLQNEAFGIDILKVQEIKGWTPVTRIPNAPDYVKGVLNLRGSIVPIFDLRMRFGMESIEYTPLTVIIVLSVASDAGARTVGIVADSVSDVLNVPKSEIKPTCKLGTKINTEFMDGIATVNDRMVMLLNSDTLLTHADAAMFNELN